MAAVTAGYVMTGDEGGDITLGDADAKANFAGENHSASDLADASLYYVAASVKPMDNVKVGLAYLAGDGKAAALTKAAINSALTTDVTELKLTASYAMSKNFKISGFLTDGGTEAGSAAEVKTDTSRVEIKYTF